MGSGVQDQFPPKGRSLQIRVELKAAPKANPRQGPVGGGVQVDGARLEEVGWMNSN